MISASFVRKYGELYTVAYKRNGIHCWATLRNIRDDAVKEMNRVKALPFGSRDKTDFEVIKLKEFYLRYSKKEEDAAKSA